MKFGELSTRDAYLRTSSFAAKRGKESGIIREPKPVLSNLKFDDALNTKLANGEIPKELITAFKLITEGQKEFASQ